MRWYVGCGVLVAAVALGLQVSRADDLVADPACTLRRASTFFTSIATHGGYVGIYSLDLRERYGESLSQSAGPGQIWIQPPGTPSVGACFLRAYRVTGDQFYRDAARNAGLALAWAQDQNGGWPYLADIAAIPNDAAAERPTRQQDSATTLDDSTTQMALTFLIDLDEVVDAGWLTTAIEIGLRYMRASQGSAGGWPQVYPARGTYADAYTFNDGVTNAAITVMLRAYRAYGSEEDRQRAVLAAEFIRKSQLPEPQSGWAQQYDVRDLLPAPARAFEPAAVDSAITASNVATLIEVYAETGDRTLLEPIPAAVDWLERSALSTDHWARFYELGTNRPIYPARDGSVRYSLDELSESDQSHYAYEGTFGIPKVIKISRKLLTDGIDDVRGWLEGARRQKALDHAERVLPAVISSLDAQGRWVREGRVRTRTFVNNCNAILDHLEYGQPGALAP